MNLSTSTHLNILLVCNLGASTGVMVSKMRAIAADSEKLRAIKINIEAHPAGLLVEKISEFDVVLLGPQIKHRLAELEAICREHQRPIGVIDVRDYGTVNGGNILKTAILLRLGQEINA